MSTDHKRIHAVVSGRVQGVTYRASTSKTAQRLGLTGWVVNLDDGRVEFVAEGDKKALDELIEWAHRGPFLARVDSVEVEWSDASDDFAEFEVRR